MMIRKDPENKNGPVDAEKDLSSLRPGDAVEVLQEVPSQRRAELLQDLPPGHAADILEILPDDMAASAVMQIDSDSASAIVREMQTDKQADLIQDLAEDHAEAILTQIGKEDADTVRRLLTYEEDTAGGLMQTEFIAVPIVMTAGEVTRYLQAKSRAYADYPASYLYVVDETGRLQGVASMRGLVLSDAKTPMRDFMNRNIISAPAAMPGEDLIKMFRRYHFLAIPVVNEQGVLLGLVTEENVMRFAEEEADEELLRFTGIVKGDEFRDMPLFARSWRRLSWLSVNIILNLVSASIIAWYQDTVRAVIALAVFLPIISDMSGCSGNQAIAVSIRELSLDRIRPRNFLWVLGKEAAIGLLNGLALGIMIGMVALIWKGSVMLGVIVGAALWINTLISVVMGGLIPLLLRAFRGDPALASSPILTTLTDMCGFFVLLALATKYLHVLAASGVTHFP